MTLARSMNKPGPKAMGRLKRLLRYLKGTTNLGITYTEDADNGDKLSAYVDADFANDQDNGFKNGYSTSGVVLSLAGGPVEWRAVKQTVVAISTVEAEYVAMSKACTMIIMHFRHFMSIIHQQQVTLTVMDEDNTGAMSMSHTTKITPRAKHVDIKFHQVRWLVEKEVVDVQFIETDLQKADILTKSMGAVKFFRCRLLLLGA